MKKRELLSARFWDKKSDIGKSRAEDIYLKRPDYKDKDIVVVTYDSGQMQVMSVDEIRAEHKETVGMKSEQVKNWFVKHRTAVLSQHFAAVQYHETGGMEAMAEMMNMIIELQDRVKQLENKQL
jgi:3-deoxy-D-manno-octulosonate 8-phosphate phosphatase KdsC-like HAD superfamily phosphatase